MIYRKVNIAFTITLLKLSVIGNFFLIEKSQAKETTIYVDDNNTVVPWNGTQNYPSKTIQEGIIASNTGDTIFVSRGTYNENLMITKDLTLTGENKDTTFIDGSSKCHVLNAQGTFDSTLQVYISKLTIRNAGGSGNDRIHFSYVKSSEISDNVILNTLEGEGISINHVISRSNQGQKKLCFSLMSSTSTFR
jgi:nitrous oxidase accessory protein NosD